MPWRSVLHLFLVFAEDALGCRSPGARSPRSSGKVKALMSGGAAMVRAEREGAVEQCHLPSHQRRPCFPQRRANRNRNFLFCSWKYKGKGKNINGGGGEGAT